MATSNATPAGAQSPQQELEDAYSSLLNSLNEAYWAAGDLNAKDKIYGQSEAVSNLLTQLDAADLEVRDGNYAAISAQVTAVNKGLQSLQNQISTIINRINTASTVAGDVAKVLTAAGNVFPAI